jgi:hypothetical protein
MIPTNLAIMACVQATEVGNRRSIDQGVNL